MYEHAILRWIHVLLMAYWLGGEWGVFNASTNVANAKLPIEERKRFLATALNIDIAPRSAIVLLLPVGLHMGANLGVSPITGYWLVLVWVAAIGWVSLVWIAFFNRHHTERYRRLNRIDDWLRYFAIPALILAGGWSLATGRPFTARWFATKLVIFGLLLVIGLLLRWTVAVWADGFRRLDTEGSTPATEALFTNSLRRARYYAYTYWLLIATMAFLGVAKPF